MATVKIDWVKKPEALENYLNKEREAEMVRSSSHGLPEKAAESIRLEHERTKSKSKNLALTIIQSWHPSESNLFSPEKYNEMGQELAKRLAPGHMAWVVTHTEKAHIHNHVVICSVHSETGKLLENKKSLIFKTREINDNIARENGLSVLAPSIKSREEKLPERAKAMVAHGKRSWRYDLLQKADFARAASTSFDEYVSILGVLGVHARIENKGISYLYGERTKAIRGKNVGDNFTKEGLIKAFRENDARFTKQPDIRERIQREVGAIRSGSRGTVGVEGNLLSESTSNTSVGAKDYGKFTKIDRRSPRDRLPWALRNSDSILHEEMKRAEAKSIFKYCEENKISLIQNQKGQTVLKGREFIHVTENGWKNTKNYTQGSIIEFVAYHHDVDFLRAISKINENPRLMMLEPLMSEHKRTFRSFYVPTEQKADSKKSKEFVSLFLKQNGYKESQTEALLKSDRMFVSKNNIIFFVNKKEDSAVGYSVDRESGAWKSVRHGKPHETFLAEIKQSKRLTVFHNPVDFILSDAERGSRGKKGSHLVMFDEKSNSALLSTVALNPQIREVEFVFSRNENLRQRQELFVTNFRKALTPFEIEVKTSVAPEVTKERSRNISLEL